MAKKRVPLATLAMKIFTLSIALKVLVMSCLNVPKIPKNKVWQFHSVLSNWPISFNYVLFCRLIQSVLKGSFLFAIHGSFKYHFFTQRRNNIVTITKCCLNILIQLSIRNKRFVGQTKIQSFTFLWNFNNIVMLMKSVVQLFYFILFYLSVYDLIFNSFFSHQLLKTILYRTT